MISLLDESCPLISLEMNLMITLAALDLKLVDGPLIPVAGTIDLAPFLIMILLLSLGSYFMRRRRGRQKMRRVVQLAAFLAFVVGFYPCACMVRDLLRGAMVMNRKNLEAFELMMLIIPVVAFAMVWGRVFCGWVCPIGFVQEMTTKLTNWMRSAEDQTRMRKIRFGLAAVLLLGTVVTYLFIRPENEPLLQGLAAGYLITLAVLIMLSVSDAHWERRLRIVRYFALSFFVAATVLGIYLHAAFCVLFTNILDNATVLLFFGVVFASLVLSQAWCRFLCPEGALLGLLTRLSGWKIRLNPRKCSGCNVCNTVCPVEAIDVGRVDERSCLYCCKCVDACPTDAIDMSGDTNDTLLRLPVMGGTGESSGGTGR